MSPIDPISSFPPLFRSAPVKAESARRAYPLIRLYESGLDQRGWNAFVRQHNRGGGVMMIEDARGAAHAVFAWRVKTNFLGERVLSVSDAVLGNLPGRALGDALIEEISALAREKDCQAIEIELPDHNSGPRREILVARGFKVVGGTRLMARVVGH